MYTFVLVLDSIRQPITAKKLLEKIGVVREEPNGRCVVDGPKGSGDGWIAISPFDSTGHDYDPDNYERIKRLLLVNDIRHPNFFLVEGRDTTTSLANDLLKAMDVNEKAVLDNDHGLIAELAIFKDLAAAGINWLNNGGGIAPA